MIAHLINSSINWDIRARDLALTGALCIVVIAGVDVLVGNRLGTLPLCMILILFVSWHGGWKFGSWFMAASLAEMLLAGLYSDGPGTKEIRFYLDTVAVAFCFLPAVMLTSHLRQALEREQRLTRTDPLTRIANRARFDDVLAYEMASLQRYRRPLAVAYIECDDLRSLDGQSGHPTGDEALCAIAETLTATVRATDLPARIGDGEFAIVLPEINPAESLRVAERVHRRLLAAMAARDWPLTFSIGLAVFLRVPPSPEDLTAKAAALMDRVRQQGKGQILQETF